MNTITAMDDINGGDTATVFKPSQLFQSPQKNKSYNQTRFFYTVGLFNFLLEENIKVENLYEFTINDVPYTPEWCSGVTSIRGNIMPVVNMHIFLKTGKYADSQNKKLMMLEHKNHAPIVFEIDKLPEVISTDHYTNAPVPKKSPMWLKKVLKNENNIIYEINHSELLRQLKNSQI
jgi:chemotaxis signal transduction protein